MARALGGGGGDHHVIGERPHLVELVRGERAGGPLHLAAAAGDGEDLDPERLQHLDQRAADPARPDDRHRQALQHARAVAPVRVPRTGLREGAERAVPGHHQRQAVLGHRPGVDPAGRGPGAVVVDRARREPGLDAGGGELDPADGVGQLRQVGRVGAEDHDRVGPLEWAELAAAGLDGGAQRGTVSGGDDVHEGSHEESRLPALRRLHAHREAESTMASVPLLSARGLVKTFGGRRVLDGLDLEVAAGARIGILGPNGGGKSTLLRLLSGLDEPDAGHRHPPPRPRRRVPAPGGARGRAHRAGHGARAPVPSWPSWRTSCWPPSAASPTRGWPTTSPR